MVESPKDREPSNPTLVRDILLKVAEELLQNEGFLEAITQNGYAVEKLISSFQITQNDVQKAKSKPIESDKFL